VVAGIATTGAAVSLLIAGITAVRAQQGPAATELKPLTFTAAQVTAGRRTYGSGCSGCHGEELQGLDGGPPLTGATFERWFEGPVSALYEFVSTNMPADNPGALTEMQYISLIAFMAAENGLMPGDVPLPAEPEALAEMGFSQPAP
jgi:mono/diheme cytochrome c family protein